jgi:hypothetical protein
MACHPKLSAQREAKDGGGGGSRIRVTIPGANVDTSGFYSISATWNQSRQNLILFNFFNSFTEHKASLPQIDPKRILEIGPL